MRAVLLILAFIISGALGSVRNDTGVAETRKDPFPSGWITAEFPVSYGLHKTGDRLGGNPAEAPSPGSQKDHHSHGTFAYRQVQFFPRWLPEYLSFSRTICIGLPVGQIIFPFHYFW